MKIADACLVISDVDAMSVFYRDVVGLRPRMRNENFADFEFPGGARLAMWEAAHIAETVGWERLGESGNRHARTFLVESAEAVEEAAARLANHVVKPVVMSDGRRRATFRDPEGFIFHVAIDPGRPARAPDGELFAAMAGVELLVADLERSAAFYATLGFAQTVREDEIVSFDGGDTSLTVTSEASATAGLPAGTFTASGHRLMGAIELDTREAVDVMYERLLAGGVAFSGAPKRWPWGAWATYFPDPDGVLWEIYAWVDEPYTW